MPSSVTIRNLIIIVLFIAIGIGAYFVFETINKQVVTPKNTSANERYDVGVLADSSNVVFVKFGGQFPEIRLVNSTIPDGTVAGVDLGCTKPGGSLFAFRDTVDVIGEFTGGIFTPDVGYTFEYCDSNQLVGNLKFNIQDFTESLNIQFYATSIGDSDIANCSFEDSYLNSERLYNSRVLTDSNLATSNFQFGGSCLEGVDSSLLSKNEISFPAPNSITKSCVLSTKVDASLESKSYFCNKFFTMNPGEPTPTPTVTVTASPTIDPTRTPVDTVTPTTSPTVSASPTNTVVPTTTAAASPTTSPTVVKTVTPTTTSTSTPTPTLKPTTSVTVSPTVTTSSTQTPTQTQTVVVETVTPTPTKNNVDKFLDFVATPGVYVTIAITLILLIGLVGGLIYYTGSRRTTF